MLLPHTFIQRIKDKSERFPNLIMVGIFSGKYICKRLLRGNNRALCTFRHCPITRIGIKAVLVNKFNLLNHPFA